MNAIITRADDCASSSAANHAIAEAVKTGFLQNVSILACGDYMEEAAELLASNDDICFGLHGCINSEWDEVLWGPVAPRDKVPSLIDHRGVFFQSQTDFIVHKPVIEQIITEYRYQLDKVRGYGFPIKYMDSHMMPELFITGLQEAMSRMMEQEGLIDHIWFNRILQGNDVLTGQPDLFEKTLAEIEGQFLMIMHPARYGSEMCMTGNKDFSGESIAAAREKDFQFLIDEKHVRLCKEYGIQLLRYDQADKQEKPYILKFEDFVD